MLHKIARNSYINYCLTLINAVCMLMRDEIAAWKSGCPWNKINKLQKVSCDWTAHSLLICNMWLNNLNQISSKFSQTFSLRHVSRVGSVVNIALFQIVNDILVLLALDGEVAKMDEMRGKFFAEICGALLRIAECQKEGYNCISCMFCFKKVNNKSDNFESDLPWLKCCFSKFVS